MDFWTLGARWMQAALPHCDVVSHVMSKELEVGLRTSLLALSPPQPVRASTEATLRVSKMVRRAKMEFFMVVDMSQDFQHYSENSKEV